MTPSRKRLPSPTAQQAKESPPVPVGLHRFAVFTAASTFCLIIAGALVTSRDAGLSVPDWPLSYGQWMPPMVGGIFYEHGHRMIASFVGLLTVILAVWLWVAESRRWVRNVGFAALAAVIAQGLLGPTPRATSARAGQTVVPEPGFPLSVNFDKRGEPPPVRRCTKFASAVRCCRHHALSGVTSYQGSGRS